MTGQTCTSLNYVSTEVIYQASNDRSKRSNKVNLLPIFQKMEALNRTERDDVKEYRDGGKEILEMVQKMIRV